MAAWANPCIVWVEKYGRPVGIGPVQAEKLMDEESDVPDSKALAARKEAEKQSQKEEEKTAGDSRE